MNAMTRRILLWSVAAVVGLALAAAMTWATSRLTSQRIESRVLALGRRSRPGRSGAAGRLTDDHRHRDRHDHHDRHADQAPTRDATAGDHNDRDFDDRRAAAGCHPHGHDACGHDDDRAHDHDTPQDRRRRLGQRRRHQPHAPPRRLIAARRRLCQTFTRPWPAAGAW